MLPLRYSYLIVMPPSIFVAVSRGAVYHADVFHRHAQVVLRHTPVLAFVLHVECADLQVRGNARLLWSTTETHTNLIRITGHFDVVLVSVALPEIPGYRWHGIPLHFTKKGDLVILSYCSGR